jgi:hypothetical protein
MLYLYILCEEMYCLKVPGVSGSVFSFLRVKYLSHISIIEELGVF